MKKRSIENFVDDVLLKFSNINFEAISLGIGIPNSSKIKDFGDFGNINKSKFTLILFSLVFVFVMANFVSAGIYFSELDSKYNLGDMIDLDVQVDPIIEGRLLNVRLFCNDNSVIEFNNLPDIEGTVNIKLPLNFFTIDQANGNCYFMGYYSDDSRKSMDFEISKKLLVRLSSDSFFIEPGQEIIVSGSAEKLNGNTVNGEVEIDIPLLSLVEVESVVEEEVVEEVDDVTDGENEVIEDGVIDEELVEENLDVLDYNTGKFYGQVVGGDFSVSINLPEDIPAGDYRIDVLVYEGSDDQRSSEGVAIANLKVFQILKSIDVALSDQSFDPGSVISIKPSLLDQTGVSIDDEISVIMRDEFGNRFFEKVIESQETIDYKIPTNFSSGYYEIESLSGDIVDLVSFFVNQKAIAHFDLVNDTLVVRSVGNVPYKKGIEIELNGKSFVKIVDLDIGEEIAFKLTGPDEEYSVLVSDGYSEVSQEGVRLTGRAVNVDRVSQGVGGLSGPVAWIFVIVILIVISLFLFRSVFKKKSFAFHFKGKKNIMNKDKDGVVKINENKDVNSGKNIKGGVINNQADQVLVMKGHRSTAAVLVLKIKNKIGDNEKQSLERAIEHVYNNKGAVYEQGDFIFVIFSPLMTKTNKNEVEAVKAAQKIVGVLSVHKKIP